MFWSLIDSFKINEDLKFHNKLINCQFAKER